MKTLSATAKAAIALCAVAVGAMAAQAQVTISLSDGGPNQVAPANFQPIFEIARQDDVPPAPGMPADDAGDDVVPAPSVDMSGEMCCPQSCLGFSLRTDVLFMNRSTKNRALFNELGTGPYPDGNPLLDLPDLGFEMGTRAAIGVQNCCAFDLEFVYMGVNQWSSAAGIFSTPMEMNDLYGMSFNVNSAAVLYESDLNSFEANVRECLSDHITLIAGIRYLQIDEHLCIDDTFPTNIGPLDERLLTSTSNDIFGMQFGADVVVWRGCNGHINVEGKAGVFYNRHDEQSSYDTDAFFLPDTAASDSDDKATFLGELGVTGVYCLAPCVNLRGGYRLLWLSDVATAPDQLDSTELNPLHPNNIFADVSTEGVFFHGGFVGLELLR